MTRIKICGITNVKDALDAVACGVDALGFVFARSPRKISAQRAAKIIEYLPPFVTKVGVFVNAEKKQVLRILRACKLNALQFHGDENDSYCSFFRKYCTIIKAFRIKDKRSLDKVKEYRNAHAYLFDTYAENRYGGTGRAFNYRMLAGRNFKKPVIIAGGITKKNMPDIICTIKPYAVDISSGVETKPGKKNRRLMSSIVKTVKAVRV